MWTNRPICSRGRSTNAGRSRVLPPSPGRSLASAVAAPSGSMRTDYFTRKQFPSPPSGERWVHRRRPPVHSGVAEAQDQDEDEGHHEEGVEAEMQEVGARVVTARGRRSYLPPGAAGAPG